MEKYFYRHEKKRTRVVMLLPLQDDIFSFYSDPGCRCALPWANKLTVMKKGKHHACP